MDNRKKGEVTLKRGTLLTLILVILVLLCLVFFLFFNKKDIDSNISNIEDKQIENQSASIRIPGYSSISIPKDKEDVQIALINPSGNPCYFVYELVLMDNEESLYKSKHIPPGKMIKDVRLNRALKEGEYRASVRITTTSLSDNSPMNGANVETLLIVK